MCCWHKTNHYLVSKQHSKQNNCNNDLLQVIGIMQTKRHRWCMLMTLDRSLCSRNLCNDLLQRRKILNIIWKQLPSISAIRATIYKLTWSLSSVITLHRSVQLKPNSDVNGTIKLSQKQIPTRCEVKRHKVVPTMEQTRRNRQNRARFAQRLWTENKLCKEYN